MLKPTLDVNNFEESFSLWEFELSKYERDNNTQLPDAIKIAVLLNETKGPLPQHLQLSANTTPTYTDVRTTIMEFYGTTTAFSRLHQAASSSVATNFNGGAAPTDIGAINTRAKGKKGHKGKGKGKKGCKGKKGHKGKGYEQQGKGKGYIGQPATPFKGYFPSNKGKGQGKAMGSGKGKAPTTGCYRCGQSGHIARDCKVSIHNLQEVDNNDYQQDTTTHWYNQYTYDNHWWTSDHTQVNVIQPQHQPQQLALPPPQQLDAPPTQALNIAAVKASSKSISQPAFDGITSNQPDIHRQQDQQLNLDRDELMIDSGAATHVCPIWFAATTPIHDLQPHETPNLRTATEDKYPCLWIQVGLHDQ